jgi:DNA polymerase sigma
MATSRIPTQPDLPDVDAPDYDRLLNTRLYELLRQIALKLDELERRIKELEP